MGTDQAAATRVAVLARGCEDGPAGAEEEEKKLAIEEEEGCFRDEPDC